MSKYTDAYDSMRAGDAFKAERDKTIIFAREIFKTPLILLMPLGKGTLDVNYHEYQWHPDKIEHWNNDHQAAKAETDAAYNLGALFYDTRLDLDVDSTNPILHGAIQHFLADCPSPYVWGRASKSVSHISYLLAAPFDRAEHQQAIKALYDAPGMRVELRGGEARSNFFTLMPGSIHSTGELVTWGKNFDPGKSASVCGNTDVMVWKLRRAVAAALLAEQVTPGDRNFYFLCLGGALARLYKQAEDNDQLDTAMDYHASLEFLTLVRRLGGDDMSDTSRATAFTSTWDKFMQNPNIPIKGGTELARLIGADGIKIRNAVYKLLSPDNEYEAIEEALSRFVLVQNPGSEFVDLDMFKATQNVPPPLNRERMIASYTRFKVNCGGKPIPLPQFLLHSNQVQLASALELRPEVPDRLYFSEFTEQEHGFSDKVMFVNSWCGFLFKPHPEPQTEADVAPFLEFIRDIIANGDPERAHWVLAWFADIFQDPGHKPGTLLALTGMQGSGKTMAGEIIGTIIGHAHYGTIGSIEDLTKEFNSRVHNKIFVQGDETGSSQRAALSRDLKALVTGATQQIVYKGKEAITVNNPARYFFTSNNSGDALRVEAGNERRYTILEVSNHRVGHAKYWKEFAEWWGGTETGSKANLRRILRYLMDYKYDKATIRKSLNTEEKRLHQVNSIPPEAMFLIQRMQDGYPLAPRYHTDPFMSYAGVREERGSMSFISPPPSHIDRLDWPTVMYLPALYQDFAEWCRLQNFRSTSAKLTALLQRLTPEAKSHKVTARIDGAHSRPIIRTFPSQEQIVHGLGQIFPGIMGLLNEAKNTEAAVTESRPSRDENSEY